MFIPVGICDTISGGLNEMGFAVSTSGFGLKYGLNLGKKYDDCAREFGDTDLVVVMDAWRGLVTEAGESLSIACGTY
jgi:hypothetical protein